MKKVYIVLVAVAAAFISCKKEQPVAPINDKTINKEVTATSCYQAVLEKDTMLLTITVKEDKTVTGTLDYIFFEKDRTSGTLQGIKKGDTLFADYTFSSEGVSSIREVVFLEKGNTLIEGFGEVVDDNKGHVAFKDHSNLKFDTKVIFDTVKCD